MNHKLIPHAAVLVGATLLLGGCTMMPKYEQPPLAVADSFKSEAGAAGAAAPAPIAPRATAPARVMPMAHGNLALKADEDWDAF